MIKARGNNADIHIFVDADHAGNTIKMCYPTGIIIFLIMAHIAWFSKKKNTIEYSIFTVGLLLYRLP